MTGRIKASLLSRTDQTPDLTTHESLDWIRGSRRGDDTIFPREAAYFHRDCTIIVVRAGHQNRPKKNKKFAAYRSGDTIAQYCAARSQVVPEDDPLHDVAWDYNHEWIELLPPAGVYIDAPALDDAGIAADLAAVAEVDPGLSATEREVFAKARIGQGLFRENVIGAWGVGEACAVTGVTLREVLIASHVRAWSDCQTRQDRLNGANGVLLCAHLDKLFDAHLISFDDNGLVIFGDTVATRFEHDERFRVLGVDRNISLNMTRLSQEKLAEFRAYLSEHRARLR
jgi:hypothetical protein